MITSQLFISNQLLVEYYVLEYEAQRTFNQESFYESLSALSIHTVFLHVLSLHLTNQILPQTQSTDHVSAVKLKTALLSAVITGIHATLLHPIHLQLFIHLLGSTHQSQPSTLSNLQDPSSSITTTSV